MAYTARQDLMIRAYLAIVAKLGPFARDAGSEGAGYVDSSLNTGAPKGFRCENCAFFRAPKACGIMRGPVDRSGVCRLYVIQQDRLKKTPLAASPRQRIDGSTG
jgi:hypothetical protein